MQAIGQLLQGHGREIDFLGRRVLDHNVLAVFIKIIAMKAVSCSETLVRLDSAPVASHYVQERA
jgi:hypothetical protein